MIPGLVRGSVLLPMCFIGFFANLFIFVVVASKRNLHVMHFFLLANLALSDFLIHFVTTFFGISMISEEWVFGLAWCKGSYFLIVSSSTSSIFLLCAVTWECHTAVVTPFKFSNDISMKKVVTVAILWIVSFLFAGGIFSGALKLVYNDHYYLCDYEIQSSVMNVVASLIFIVPFTIITKHQCNIYRVVKLQKHQLAQQEHAINFNSTEGEQQRNFIKNVKESKDALIVVVSFLLSYLPFVVINNFRSKFPESDAIYRAWFLAQLFVVTGSLANPFIYCFRKRQLRQECLQFFWFKKISNRVTSIQ